MAAAALSVSKRSHRSIAALLCLVALLLLILASCDGERDPIPMAARAALGER